MAGKRRTNGSKVNLTPDEIARAARCMMLGAQAHQRASAYCQDNPTAKPPSMDALFFPAVAFELLLNSIEQSLRLILFIQYLTPKPIHNISALYKAVINRSGGKDGIRSDIVRRVTALGSSLGMEVITEADIRACLRKHDSSYSSFRYFGLDDEGRSTEKWEMKGYEVNVLNCLAVALIALNHDALRTRGIQTGSSLRSVAEPDMTDEQRELLVRMREQSTR